ncbi:MAG TPA: GAF domain-containing protein, partial [Frankiaceae bacterium]|nr:GAF domain-containing protein [Frankiaceae bacterium]
ERHARVVAEAARREAETARSQLELLARASDLLGRSLDEHEVTGRLAELVVEALADRCTVLLPDGHGRLPPRVSARADRARGAAWADLPAGGFDVAGPSPAARVFRSGQPLLVPDAGHGPAAVPPRGGCAAALPMTARGRTIGVLCVARDRGRPGYTPAEASLLAHRAAVALDNARLFGQQRHIVSRLQESLLPAELPDIDGLELAVRHATAGPSRSAATSTTSSPSAATSGRS